MIIDQYNKESCMGLTDFVDGTNIKK